MTPMPTTVLQDTSIESALGHMRVGRLRRLPVVNGSGALVGIVTLDDILALLAEEFSLIGGLLERETPHQIDGAAMSPAQLGARGGRTKPATQVPVSTPGSARTWRFVRPFASLTLDDIPLVGGKNASFGEMIRALAPLGVRVPDGFALTADAYRAAARRPRACARRCATRCARLDIARRRLAARGGRALRGARSARRRCPTRWCASSGEAYAALSRQYGEDGDRRRRALERHRRGPPDRELRRPAGDLPQRARTGGAARGVPQVLRVALHRPRHRLPRRARLRPREGLSLGRRAEDGALRPGRLGRDVHARHRERLRPRRSSSPPSTAWARTSCRAS